MDGDWRVAPTDGNGMSTREHWDGCPSVFDLRWDVRVMGCRGDPSGQDERIDGGTVHTRGDGGWRWVGRPYVVMMYWNVGRPVRADVRIVGETVHARGDDGWRWVGPPLRMAMECQRENTGMNVPVFLI
jgi:hypothetical protein